MQALYRELLKKYGRQGWWPLLSNDLHSNSLTIYHPGNYIMPCKESARLEICIGAILTQNTTWQNVEKALHNLKKADLISIKKLLDVNLEYLAGLIKPSGYYNQKARKLKVFIRFLDTQENRKPGRDELLSLWGIGRETADSMLLYAWQESIMVIDAYTRRVLKKYGYSCWDLPYDELKLKCEKEMPKDYRILQEFHALLVAAGKELKTLQIRGV